MATDLASLNPSDPDYWEAIRHVEPASWPDTHPHPIHTSRDPWPAGFEKPAAVVKLEAELLAYGFRIRSTYARGFVRAVKVGTYREVQSICVRFETHGRQGYAIYETAVARKAWTWTSVGLARRDHFPFLQASRTDLSEWIAMRGIMFPAWYSTISKRVTDQKERQREAARNRTKKGSQDVS